MASGRDPSGWRGRPLTDVLPWAQELTSVVHAGYPVEISAEDRVSGYASAFLARAAALLGSMICLARCNDRESMPIIYRVLYETWLFAVYLIKGGDLALQELDEQLNYEQRRVARALDLDPPSGDGRRLSVQNVADRVREQLGDDFPMRAYDSHYRVTSYHWSHGHLGSLTHFFYEEDKGPCVAAERVDEGVLESSTLLLAMGVSLVAGLANLAMTEANVPVNAAALTQFLQRWHRAADQ